jgi:thiamine kinase-like enzyme
MKRYFLIIFCIFSQMHGMEEQPKKHWSKSDELCLRFSAFIGNINSYTTEPLVGGLLGEAPVLCTVNGNKYVARVFKGSPNGRDYDDSRRIKVGIHFFAAIEGLAPKIYNYSVLNNDYDYVIMDFIDTHTLSLEQAHRPEVINCVARKLHRIDKLGRGLETSNKETVFDEIMRLHNAVEKKKIPAIAPILEGLKNTAATIEQKIKDDGRPLVINHNDFHPRNIFFIDNDIKIIDWDTLCLNYQFYDLAGYSLFTCLNKEQDLHLLTEYLECKPTQSDIDYFKKVKLAGRVCLVLSGLQFVESVLEDISVEPIEDFEYYATAFARDNSSDSSEFFYKFGMSQLKELRREYKEFESI